MDDERRGISIGTSAYYIDESKVQGTVERFLVSLEEWTVWCNYPRLSLNADWWVTPAQFMARTRDFVPEAFAGSTHVTSHVACPNRISSVGLCQNRQNLPSQI